MASKASTKTGVETIPFSTPSDAREIKKTKEQWSEYSLDDGTVLKVRPVVIEVRRARRKFTEQGNPLYYVRLGQIIATKSPESLMKPVRKTRKARPKLRGKVK